MPILLHIDSSRELGREFVSSWKAVHADGNVIYRDVSANVPSHVHATWIGAAYTPAESRSSEQNAALALSETLIAELEQADEYVIDVAMHNFGIPSTLKLWIDQIARVNRTFSYSSGGPKGLLTGKKATILLASGGSYDAGTPYAPYNFADPYLKTVLGFLGVIDIHFVAAGNASSLMQPTTDREAFLKPVLEKVRSIAA